MSKIAYIAGRFIPTMQATTSIFDRGYQFADAAYEVITVIEGVFLDADPHLKRLERTLTALDIAMPLSQKALLLQIKTLMAYNHFKTGLIYLQVSRGIAPRKHVVSGKLHPILVMTCTPMKKKSLIDSSQTLKVMLAPDLRHQRCDLKTVGLLPNVLGMMEAQKAGYDDVLFYDHTHHITEGASWNLWIIDKNNILRTRYLDTHILHGITRATLLEYAKAEGIMVQESTISIDDLYDAQEVFATSASKFCVPIVQINDHIMPQQNVFTPKMRDLYIKRMNIL